MDHLVPRKFNFKYDRGHLSFLSPHNICWFIHGKDCSDLIKCFPHSYNIPIVAQYVNRGFVDVSFVSPNS